MNRGHVNALDAHVSFALVLRHANGAVEGAVLSHTENIPALAPSDVRVRGDFIYPFALGPTEYTWEYSFVPHADKVICAIIDAAKKI
jgi:hypothetical protein